MTEISEQAFLDRLSTLSRECGWYIRCGFLTNQLTPEEGSFVKYVPHNLDEFIMLSRPADEP